MHVLEVISMYDYVYKIWINIKWKVYLRYLKLYFYWLEETCMVYIVCRLACSCVSCRVIQLTGKLLLIWWTLPKLWTCYLHKTINTQFTLIQLLQERCSWDAWWHEALTSTVNTCICVCTFLHSTVTILLSITEGTSSVYMISLFVSVFVMCLCVCVCPWYTSVCVCVCVCVYYRSNAVLTNLRHKLYVDSQYVLHVLNFSIHTSLNWIQPSAFGVYAHMLHTHCRHAHYISKPNRLYS